MAGCRQRASTAPASAATLGRGDRLHFLRSWVSDPLRVAAVAPSGQRLARLITAEITPHTGPVLELGPGTGVFTRALLDRGVPEEALTLVEMGPDFADLLRKRFPRARIVQGSAAKLSARALFPDERAGAVISGLGLLSMPPPVVLSILTRAFACLGDRGSFYQFTYGPRCPVHPAILSRLGLTSQWIGGTWANLPPASVYRMVRGAGGSAQGRPRRRLAATEQEVAVSSGPDDAKGDEA